MGHIDDDRMRAEREDGHILSFDSLQAKIDYRFSDRELLIQALTHSSYVNEIGLGREASNERLEFLGDAVLELISSDYLYQTHPREAEGEMTRVRSGLVCEPALAECAARLDLGDHLRIGRGEDKSGGRTRPSITSDALEALIGALYLDGGIAVAKRFIMDHILDEPQRDTAFIDSKTALQEYVQAHGRGDITYRLIGAEGPDHARTFTMAAVIGGDLYESGSGRSKKAAEQEAAKATLSRLIKQQES